MKRLGQVVSLIAGTALIGGTVAVAIPRPGNEVGASMSETDGGYAPITKTFTPQTVAEIAEATEPDQPAPAASTTPSPPDEADNDEPVTPPTPEPRDPTLDDPNY